MPPTNPYQPLTLGVRTRFVALRPDWDEVTTTTTFQDGGRSFNLSSDVAPQRWFLVVSGLSKSEAAIFDAHYDYYKLSSAFSINDPNGSNLDYVFYKSYTDPDAENASAKTYLQSRQIVFVKYPYTTDAVFF